MKKAVKPRLKPSHRMKKRYILFQYTASKNVSFYAIKTLLHKLAIKPLSLIEFHPRSGMGIVRCERSRVAMVRKALNEIGLLTLKTSGSLKKLREKQ